MFKYYLIAGIIVILAILSYFVYTKCILPKKALWRFFAEYRSYADSFFHYLRLTSKRNVEVMPLRMNFPNSEKRYIYGGFIILHGREETFIKHMVFILEGDDSLSLFKIVVGKIESLAFMRNPHTMIVYDVPVENEETIEALCSLGYKKLRTFLSTHRVRMVKSKIMN